jgi:hypothetical protein
MLTSSGDVDDITLTTPDSSGHPGVDEVSPRYREEIRRA